MKQSQGMYVWPCNMLNFNLLNKRKPAFYILLGESRQGFMGLKEENEMRG